MDEFPAFVFSQSQASVYAIVERYNPAMLEHHPPARGRGPLGSDRQPLGRERQEPGRRREPLPAPALHPALHAEALRPEARGRAHRLVARHLRARAHHPDLPRARRREVPVPAPARRARGPEAPAGVLVARPGRLARARAQRHDRGLQRQDRARTWCAAACCRSTRTRASPSRCSSTAWATTAAARPGATSAAPWTWQSWPIFPAIELRPGRHLLRAPGARRARSCP